MFHLPGFLRCRQEVPSPDRVPGLHLRRSASPAAFAARPSRLRFVAIHKLVAQGSILHHIPCRFLTCRNTPGAWDTPQKRVTQDESCATGLISFQTAGTRPARRTLTANNPLISGVLPTNLCFYLNISSALCLYPHPHAACALLHIPLPSPQASLATQRLILTWVISTPGSPMGCHRVNS